MVTVLPARIYLGAGIFNGVEDLGNSISDPDIGKEIDARLFAHPFSQSDRHCRGLGIGVGGTWGEKKAPDAVNRQVGDYRSPGQEQVSVTAPPPSLMATTGGLRHKGI